MIRERHCLVGIPVNAAAVEAAGERLLAEYTFVHTPSA